MSLTTQLQKTGVTALCYKGLKMAVGTTTNSISDDFELTSYLEIYNVGRELTLCKKVTAQYRFFKLLWIPYTGYDNGGLLIASNDNNAVCIYDVAKIFALNDDEDIESTLISSLETKENILAMDYHETQKTLVVGGQYGECVIFDMNDLQNITSLKLEQKIDSDITKVNLNTKFILNIFYIILISINFFFSFIYFIIILIIRFILW